jgi:uracil-DNA glycosylase
MKHISKLNIFFNEFSCNKFLKNIISNQIKSFKIMFKKLKIHSSWLEKLKDEFEKDYFKSLINFVKKEYLSQKIYPEEKNIFKAFNLCPFEKIKVVILGQDPYHGPNQANGLCFSVNDETKKPPSLKNIFKEIESDLKIKMPNTGNLENWSKQGVFLLNATLTVRARQAASHQKRGWEEFTDAIIKKSQKKRKTLFFYFGGNMHKKKGN